MAQRDPRGRRAGGGGGGMKWIDIDSLWFVKKRAVDMTLRDAFGAFVLEY